MFLVQSWSIIKALPPVLDVNSSNLAEAWRRWRSSYETYFKLCDRIQLPEFHQVSFLLHALSETVNAMYFDMDWHNKKDKLKHDAIQQRFKEKFAQSLKRIAEVFENSHRSRMLIDRKHFTQQPEVNQVNLLRALNNQFYSSSEIILFRTFKNRSFKHIWKRMEKILL